MISTEHQWNPQEQESKRMKLQAGGDLGRHMDKMAITLDLLWKIKDVIRFISPKLEETELWKKLFFLEKFTLPFHSPQDLATQAAVDLTHDLLHPQRTGQFFKVGDAQTVALKRLADIFEGATQRKTKIVVPPTEKRRQQCTSEGATRSLTSKGAKHSSTASVSPEKHDNTLNNKSTSPTKNVFHTSSHTTYTTYHGATQC
jgi:hypothetical protein